MEGDKMLLMKAEFAKREEEYQEIIRLLQEDYEKYKADTSKEFEIQETLSKRKDDYAELLRKELMMAQNIIKNPGVYNKA
jgi:ABC-type Na+ transport system ATPase subunit NatA